MRLEDAGSRQVFTVKQHSYRRRVNKQFIRAEDKRSSVNKIS